MSAVEELRDDREDYDAAPLSDMERHEIERRLEEHEREPNDTIPWEEVKRKVTCSRSL